MPNSSSAVFSKCVDKWESGCKILNSMKCKFRIAPESLRRKLKIADSKMATMVLHGQQPAGAFRQTCTR